MQKEIRFFDGFNLLAGSGDLKAGLAQLIQLTAEPANSHAGRYLPQSIVGQHAAAFGAVLCSARISPEQLKARHLQAGWRLRV
jgi:hypothetical protein